MAQSLAFQRLCGFSRNLLTSPGVWGIVLTNGGDRNSAMTIELEPEQAQTIDQGLRAGLIESADEVVEAGLGALRGPASGLASLRERGGMDARFPRLGSQPPDYDAYFVR